MSVQHIPPALRALVAQRARGRCEYCLIPDDVGFAPHEPDHIIAAQHGGQPTQQNLALACWRCNRYKGTNLASVDPQTGRREFLFDPRRDRWQEHFKMEGAMIIGLSVAGRATVALLRFNSRDRIEVRKQLVAEGRFAV